MDAKELRVLRAPLKERCRQEPKAAVVALEAEGTLDDTNIACKVETGRALGIAGLHPATCCWKRWWPAPGSPSRRWRLRSIFRGTLGVAKDATVGFRQIRLSFDLDSDAAQDRLDQLLKLTERYCVIYQTIKSGAPVDVTLARV